MNIEDVMNMDDIVRMAQLQTVLDTIELLATMRPYVFPAIQQKADEMAQRLSTMATTLAPGK